MNLVDLEPIWTGSTWRSFPQPQMATRSPMPEQHWACPRPSGRPSASAVSRGQYATNKRPLVLAACDEAEWRSVLDIMARTGIAYHNVARHMTYLWRAQAVDRVRAPQLKAGAWSWLYRKRQAA
jgi:hypothetical protein